MRYIAALSLATALVQFGTTVNAQSRPANDDIANAINLSAESRIANVLGKIVNSTSDVGIGGGPSVWYKFEAPISGKIFSQVKGLGYFMWVGVITFDTDELGFEIVSEQGVSTSYGNSGTSINTDNYDVVGGKTYYIGVFQGSSLDVNVRANYDFSYVHLFTAGKISDSFADRTPIGGNKFTINSSLASFTSETDEPEHSSTAVTPARRTGWVTVTRPTRTQIKITATSNTFEPLMAAYTGTDVAALTRVAQSTSSGSARQTTSTLAFVAEANTPYAIAFDGNQNKAGAFTLSFEASTVRPGFLVRPVSTTVFQGDSAFFTATAATTGEPTFEWQKYNPESKTWISLLDDPAYSGADSDSLSVFGATLAMNGDKFRLTVTDDVGTSTSSTAILTVTELPPYTTERLGSALIDLSTGSLGLESGLYQAKGLPKGFALDPVTGVITANTILAKAGSYAITYWTIQNGVKSTVQNLLLIIEPYSNAFVGKFEALLLNDTQIPVAKLELTVNTSGAYTGKIFSFTDSKTAGYRGQLSLDQEARTSGGNVLLNKGAQSLELTINESSRTLSANLLEGESVIAGTTTGVALGTFSNASPAEWARNYTALIKDVEPTSPSANPLPAGDGFATGRIAANTGALSLRGRTADGVPFTANLRSSTTASYRLGQKIYSGTGGYITGTINLVERGDAPLIYNAPDTGESFVYINKPAREKDKSYPLGFNNLKYDFWMEPWIPVAGNIPATLGLNETGEMEINLNAPDITNEPENSRGLPRQFVINPKGKITASDTNTARFSINFSAANGSFTGSFIVVDQPDTSPRPITRRVTFAGVLLQQPFIYEGAPIGGGYMLVPPIPSSGESTISAEFEALAGPPALPF